MSHEAEIFGALSEAGARELAPHEAAWLGERLKLGYCPEAHNIGGLRCTIAHDHTGDGCVTVPGLDHRLARFRSWQDAARTLIATARRAAATSDHPAPDLPLVGYRSTHPAAGETGEADTADIAKRLAELVDPLGTQLLWGPSAEAEASFRGLLADWESFEKQGVPDKVPELRDTYIAWIKFRDAWQGGHPDEKALNPAISDANRVRRTLAEKAGKPQPEDRPNVQFDDLNARHAGFGWLTRKIDASLPASIPQPLKAPVGIGLVALGVLVLVYLGAPLLTLVGGGRTVVVVPPSPPPPAERRKRA